MLILVSWPLIYGVAFVQRLAQLYAPSNVLVRNVRSSAPGLRAAGGLAALAIALILTMHAVASWVALGGPAWLHLVVLLLAWDSMKVALLAGHVLLRHVCAGGSGSLYRERGRGLDHDGRGAGPGASPKQPHAS